MSENLENKIFVPEYSAKCGYLNTSGKIVIAPKYRFGAEFKGGLALVVEDKHLSDSILGIDKSGTVLFAASGKKYIGSLAGLSDNNGDILDGLRLFNLFLAQDEGNFHEVVDGKGKLYWPHGSNAGAEERLHEWKKRAIQVRNLAERGNFAKFFEKADQYGFVKPQTEGRALIHHRSPPLPAKFSEGLSHIGMHAKSGRIETVLVSIEGHLVAHLAPEILEVADFHEGRAAVRQFHLYFDADGNLKTQAIGFIGSSGGIEIAPLFDTTSGWQEWRFSDGLCPVSKNGYFGAIDRDGAIVIDYRFSRIWNFSEGLAAVLAFVSKDGAVIDARDYKPVVQDWKSTVEYVLTLLNKNLSRFKSSEYVRFSFHINHKFDPQISFQTEASSSIKEVIEATWHEIVLPLKGYMAAPDGRAYFVLHDGKVDVALSKKDPQIRLIMEVLNAKFREFHSGVKETVLSSSQPEIQSLIGTLGFARAPYSYSNLLPGRRVWIAS